MKARGALLLSPLLFELGASGCAPGASHERWLDRPLQAAAAPQEAREEPLLADPLAQLLQRVAVLRQLEPGPPPALVDLPAGELARRARQQFERDVPEQVRSVQALLLQRLGLVPNNFDLAAALEGSFPGRLEAFYAGEPPTLYVDAALSPAERQRALAHELVHALQDRAHRLTRRLRYEPGAWDAQSALHALAEADALAVVERLGLAASPEPEREIADGAGLPGVIARSLAAPYLDARGRVSELLAQGGFGAVDAQLEHPPASTHELLHPNDGVALPALAEFPAPSAAYRPLYADVLGEQSLRNVLEEWSSGAEASRVASGWAADRVSAFVSEVDVAIVWELALQRSEQAEAVARELRAARPPAAPAGTPVAEWSCGADGDGAVVGVWRHRDRVRFGSFRWATAGGCAALGSWLRGTWVR